MQSQLAHSSAPCKCGRAVRASRRAVVAVRATQNPWQTVQKLVVSGAAAALLVLGAPQTSLLQPSPVHAEENVVEEAYDQEAAVEEQKSMLNFMLQQQENAKRAALLSQRQQLQAEVGRVEAALQARLTQQKANVVGATQSGDTRAVESATAAATELEEKQIQVIKAAAQLSSQLDRMELLERARSVAAKQTIERAASNIDGAVNAKLNPWLEALSKTAK